jgi:hypothetical protein
LCNFASLLSAARAGKFGGRDHHAAAIFYSFVASRGPRGADEGNASRLRFDPRM